MSVGGNVEEEKHTVARKIKRLRPLNLCADVRIVCETPWPCGHGERAQADPGGCLWGMAGEEVYWENIRVLTSWAEKCQESIVSDG